MTSKITREELRVANTHRTTSCNFRFRFRFLISALGRFQYEKCACLQRGRESQLSANQSTPLFRKYVVLESVSISWFAVCNRRWTFSEEDVSEHPAPKASVKQTELITPGEVFVSSARSAGGPFVCQDYFLWLELRCPVSVSSLKSATSQPKMRVRSVVSTSLVLVLLNGEDSNRSSMATHVQAARYVGEGFRLSEDASLIPRAIGVRCGARFPDIRSTFWKGHFCC